MLLAGSLLTFVSALLSLSFGFVYVLRKRFMPYHGVALNKSWEELTPQTQVLLLALMRTCGGGLLAVGVAEIFLQVQFIMQPQVWIIASIFAISLTMTVCAFYSVFLVKFKTKATPPIASIAAFFLIMMAGQCCNYLSMM